MIRGALKISHIMKPRKIFVFLLTTHPGPITKDYIKTLWFWNSFFRAPFILNRCSGLVWFYWATVGPIDAWVEEVLHWVTPTGAPPRSSLAISPNYHIWYYNYNIFNIFIYIMFDITTIVHCTIIIPSISSNYIIFTITATQSVYHEMHFLNHKF